MYQSLDLHTLRADFDPDEVKMQQPLQKELSIDVRRVTTTDVFEQACSITAWQQLYDQLTPGSFQGSLLEVWLDGLQFFKETSSHALRRSCIVWPGSVWFGIPKPGNKDSFIHFFKVEQNSITSCSGGAEFELITPSDFKLMGLVVDENELVEYFDHFNVDFHAIFNQDNCLKNVDQIKKDTFCQLMNHTFSQVEQNSQELQSATRRQQHKEQILHSLVDLLASSTGQVSTRNSQRVYRQIISKARNYLIENRGRTIDIPELCDHLHTSRRTLQNAFQSILGVSPVHYIKAIRLNAVRRELLSQWSVFPVIQDAAASWGFSHMSQFAADYQRFFGERPSDTLANRGQVFQKIVNR